jgi:N-acetyl-S-(2-succino)cysteine monooxygenase
MNSSFKPDSRKKLRLATFLTPGDVHVSSWKHPNLGRNNGADFQMYAEAALIAEGAKFDLALLGDVPSRSTDPIDLLDQVNKYDVLDPSVVISGLSVITKNIGLAATASTTYNEPYHIARRFASIDHISSGRAAWNVVTTANPTEALNFGSDRHPAPQDRYARAEEFVDVVRGLWDSWRSDSFIRDRARGIYFNPQHFRPINHKGKHFSVRGPLDVARSPQGHPVLVQAGSSDAGQALAARIADIVFTSQQSIELGCKFYNGLKGKVGEFGRAPDEVIIVSGMMPYVGKTDSEAKERFEELLSLISPSLALAKLGEMLGDIDLSEFDWNAPLPEALPPPKTSGITSRRNGVIAYGRKAGLTLGQLARWLAATRGHYPMIGSVNTVADTMEEWFTAGAVDGFLIFPYSLPEGLQEFCTTVVPELQRRGLFKTEYSASTLRESLGLRIPAAKNASTVSSL